VYPTELFMCFTMVVCCRNFELSSELLKFTSVVWLNLADTPVNISPGRYKTLISLILQYRDTDCHEATAASPSGSTSRLNGREVTRICPVGFDDTTADDTTTGASATPLASLFGAVGIAVGMAVFAFLL
jgi:hypothetical protein